MTETATPMLVPAGKRGGLINKTLMPGKGSYHSIEQQLGHKNFLSLKSLTISPHRIVISFLFFSICCSVPDSFITLYL